MTYHLLTSSRLKVWQACPRQHHYRYELARVSLATSRALSLGTATHAGLEAWWRAVANNSAVYALPAAIVAAEAAYPSDDPYAVSLLRALLAAYDARWSGWAQTVTVLGVEVPFACALRHPTLDLSARTWRVAGKIDVLARLEDGRVAIIEHKCVAGDARVFNHETGLYERVDALHARNAAPLVTAMDETGVTHIVRAKPVRVASVRPIYRVTTLGGRSLRVSGNHPILTQRGWIYAQDLNSNDWVATPKSMSSACSEAPLSDEEIRLIGYMIGDGSLSNMAFTKTDATVMSDVVRCAAAVGEVATPKYPTRKPPYVRFSRVGPVRSLMERAGMTPETRSAAKRFPLHLALSDHQLGQLIGALWSTDGCIDVFDGRKLRIIYTSVSRGLCEDIQHVLQRLGVVSNVRTTSVLYKGERRPVSTVNVVSCESKRWFLALVKRGVVPVLRSKAPLHEAEAYIPASRQGDDSVRQPMPSVSVWWDRVESVEVQAAEQTYDLEVPGLHTFVVEGIVTHNTTSQDAGAGSDYRRKLTLDPQVSTYFDGAEALGHEADLCLYDVLKKPSIKPLLATPVESQKRKKDGTLYANQRERDETPAEYEQRLLLAIMEEPDRYLVHAEIVRSDAERENHRFALWHAVRAIEEGRVALARARGDVRAVPQYARACLAYGSPCAYLPVCEGTATIDDTTLYARLESPHVELMTNETNETNGTNGTNENGDTTT